MANSKYEYVRTFERDEILLPNTWIVVRIDGRGFGRLSTHYSMHKPNDRRSLNLMNAAARHVMTTTPEICFAYGVSDEYSFVFRREARLWGRRREKLVTAVVSGFTAAFVRLWGTYFGTDGEGNELDVDFLPTFDGRAICYPSLRNLRDYLAWRQVDCHVNNLYNTTFWALVRRGEVSTTQAELELKGTLAKDKNEILWSRFGLNYNDEDEMFRRGSCVFRESTNGDGQDLGDEPSSSKDFEAEGSTYRIPGHHEAMVDQSVDVDERMDGVQKATREIDEVPDGDADRRRVESTVHGNQLPAKTGVKKKGKRKPKSTIVVAHVDIIKDDFWIQKPWILGHGDCDDDATM